MGLLIRLLPVVGLAREPGWGFIAPEQGRRCQRRRESSAEAE